MIVVVYGKGDVSTVLLCYFGDPEENVPSYIEKDTSCGFLCRRMGDDISYEFKHDQIDWIHFLLRKIVKRGSTILDIYGSGKLMDNSDWMQYLWLTITLAELIEEAAARKCDVVSLQRSKSCLEYISTFLNSIDETRAYSSGVESEEEPKSKKNTDDKKKYPLRNKIGKK